MHTDMGSSAWRCCPSSVVTIAICAFVVYDWTAGSVGLMSILLGLLLMRQHVVTKTNFLERIVVAFEISKQTPS